MAFIECMKTTGWLANFILHPLPKPRPKELHRAAQGIRGLGPEERDVWGDKPGLRLALCLGKMGF